MPNWRKVITSGSDASLNSLTVTNGITGSLYGTARFVDTGSLTSSFVTLNTQQSISGFKSFSALSTAILQIEDQVNLGNYGQILLSEDVFNFRNINVDNVFTAGTSSLEFGLGTSGKLDLENLSTNRIYQLPDKDGTISLLSDIVGVTGSFVTTGSFNDFTGSYNTGSFTGSFTGSLQGTASNAISASWAPIPDINTGSLATTGSNIFNGNQILTGSLQITNGITGSLLSNELSGYTTDLSSSYTSRSFVDRNYVNNASNITSGTLNDARLSSNIALRNAINTFTENQTISKSNPQLDIISATTAKATLLRGETTNTFSLTNDVLEIGGASSNCISFNNTNQYIDANPTGITGLTQWTFACWINRLSTNSSNIVYIGDGTNALQLLIIGSTSTVVLQARGSLYGGNAAYTTIPSSGWVHIAVVYSGGNAFIYVNGNLNVTSPIGSVSSVTKFRIGNANLLPNYNSVGFSNAPTNQPIDQVLFYNTALTLANVQIISAGTTTLPSTGNLLLRYELNEGTDVSTVNQGTASNGNGTLVNGVVWETANGRIPTEAAIQLGTAINIRDGILNGERGQYRFGDPFGGTIIRGRSIKFQSPLESKFSFIHNGNTLLNPANTSTTATGSSTLTIIGNTSIGASNIAAPSNGLAVSGRTLIGTSTDNTTDQLQVSGSSLFTGNQRVIGNQTITGSLLVSGSTTITGATTITGSLLINTSGSFVLPLNPMSSPQTGSAYWSGSFLYIWDGIQYRSSSFS